MKRIRDIMYVSFLLFVLMGSSIFAQIHDRKNAPYIGVWEYQKDDRIFRLIIWENPIADIQDKRYYLNGDYEIAQVDGIIETILHASEPESIVNKMMPVSFTGTVDDGIYHGKFEEVYGNAFSVLGKFRIVNVTSCPDCQPRISWEMTQLYRIDPVTNKPVASVPFIVPNGIILIKVK